MLEERDKKKNNCWDVSCIDEKLTKQDSLLKTTKGVEQGYVLSRLFFLLVNEEDENAS